MILSRVALATTAVALCLLQACSSSDDGTPSAAEQQAKVNAAFNTPTAPSFVDNSVKADQHFSDSTDATSSTQLTVATAGNEALLANVKVGTILAGDRNSQNVDPTTSTNAYGFLRRVTGVAVVGGNTVLQTVPAELDEWIKDGDLDFSNPNSIFTTTTPTIGAKSLRILDDPAAVDKEAGSKGEKAEPVDVLFGGTKIDVGNGIFFTPRIQIKNSKMDVNAQYDGFFKVRNKLLGIPRQAQFKSLLTIDPVVSGDFVLSVALEGEGQVAIGTVYNITIKEYTIDLPGVIIILPGPIPISIRYHPRLKCTLGASGVASVTINAKLTSHGTIGFQGDASPTNINVTDLTTQPTFTPTYSFQGGQVKATLEAECGVLAVPEVLAFDAVGLSGEFGPYVDWDVNACDQIENATNDAGAPTNDGGFSISHEYGYAQNFNSRMQLPILGIGKDFPLVTYHGDKTTPVFFYGDENTCKIKPIDSCFGKTDGFYCATANTYSGYNCQNGQILNGQQCQTLTQKCISGTTSSILCQ